MKNVLLTAAVVAATVSLLVVFQSCGVLGGPPGGLQIGAATDSTVLLAWTSPAQGMPDSFLVYFRPVGDSNFVLVAETSGTTHVHNPHGMTGFYRVAAVFADRVYDSPVMLTTVPVHETTKVISELDGAGNAGYGWNRDSGRARTYSMREAGNAQYVDFYITDFATGSSRLNYCIASPSMGPSDPSGIVPQASWRTSGFTDSLPNATDPLPVFDPRNYFNYTEIRRTPFLIGACCYTSAENKYFALLKVTNVDVGSATVELESWFQLVANLRLIRH